jgi:hypothetical protein
LAVTPINSSIERGIFKKIYVYFEEHTAKNMLGFIIIKTKVTLNTDNEERKKNKQRNIIHSVFGILVDHLVVRCDPKQQLY